MFIFIFLFQLFQDCTDIGATLMKCKTPDLKPSNLTIPFTINKGMIGFILDGVSEFRSLTHVENVREKFEVVQDPVYRQLAVDGNGRVWEKMHSGDKFLEIRVSTEIISRVLIE